MDFDLYSYDKYIISFSGGKDSTALLLFLLDNGVPKERIELWHQEIDGREESFFDWEVTPDYCRKLSEAFGIPILYQWKVGGFKREMLRDNSLTAPICFEKIDGSTSFVGGTKGKPSTRRRFPQPSSDWSVSFPLVVQSPMTLKRQTLKAEHSPMTTHRPRHTPNTSLPSVRCSAFALRRR